MYFRSYPCVDEWRGREGNGVDGGISILPLLFWGFFANSPAELSDMKRSEFLNVATEIQQEKAEALGRTG